MQNHNPTLLKPTVKNIKDKQITIIKIMSWIKANSEILCLGKTIKIQLHIKGNDVKGDVTIFPDHS